MAVEGMQRYDPTRAKLRTHLMSHLQGLQRISQQENQIISIPERVSLDSYHLNKAETDLRDSLGREPSSSELADHTGMSLKRMSYVRKAQPGLAEGSLRSTGEDGEEGAVHGPAVMGSDNHDAWAHYIYHDLPPVDQSILEHSIGLHGRKLLSKQELSRKLKLSPGSISQRSARIQALLDKREELSPGVF